MKKITIIIPCFNEIHTLPQVMGRIQNVSLPCEKEIIVVDDASTDGSREYIKEFQKNHPHIQCIYHEKNLGKASAVRSGLKVASGDYVIVQDADLEYSPSDIEKLYTYAREHDSLVVYGTRNKEIKNKFLYPHYYFGSKILTILINFLFKQRITDPETCYKLIRRELMTFLDLRESHFGIEIEITAKIGSFGIKIPEVSISYAPRSFGEGKKIKTRDGIHALFLIFKYAFFDLHYGIVDRFIRFFRIRQVQKYLKISPNDTVLEVGCGRQGALGWKMRKSIKQYFGLDKSLVKTKIGNMNFVQDDVANIKKHFINNQFDAVIALAFIEHINEPEKFLQDCQDVLKHNGFLIITTPPPISKPILRILSLARLINGKEILDHKNYFSSHDIKKIVTDSGLRVIHLNFFLFGFNMVIVAQRQ